MRIDDRPTSVSICFIGGFKLLLALFHSICTKLDQFVNLAASKWSYLAPRFERSEARKWKLFESSLNF